ncbi:MULTISPECIES: hypothetical protein [Mumia]|uniref:hypothetical protein n=1 Tax=Mumia TaxID=1546255 RepID=UPI001423DEB9|nr:MULTISPECIES: hypothetical protein [unclassified Mumia]QMW67959.1 hypothetical protein H4N58_08995 [Mumia sp. ZJ1417]
MNDLQVATQELRDLGTRLTTLCDRLKSADGRASYGKEHLAHEDVVDAMDKFRKNWDDNRDHLADKLLKLGELATETANGFEEADEKLAAELVKAIKEAKKEP